MSKFRPHESSINNTWLRRNLTLAAITILKRYRPRSSSVLFLTRRICVKYDPFQCLSQAEALRFIASETSIPVPKVFCAFERKGNTYIVMSRIAGSTIGRNWSKRPEESKQRLLEQLQGYINQMRALTPPTPGAVEGIGGSRLYDMRLPVTADGFGPFESISDFHSFLTNGVSASEGEFPEVNDPITMYKEFRFATCFIHGDLSSANILVDKDKVVGIVDWETCGWYPEYWEYTSAYNCNVYNEFWRDEIGKFLPEYPEAVKMEDIRWKYFGAF